MENMLTEHQLKRELQAHALPDAVACTEARAIELLPAMLLHIGSTDAVLRDDLIYGTMATWLLERKWFSAEIKKTLVTTLLDENHLFRGIGEQNTDTVFTRSFSVLQLPLLLIAHRATAYLDRDTLHQIKDKVLAYLAQERDLRGYVPDKGWAHGVAHAADALEDLAQCEALGVVELQEMMDGIAGAISAEAHPFIHDEDERAVTAVTTILGRNLIGDDWLTAWLQKLAAAVEAKPWSPINFTRSNSTHFLQALYMRLNHLAQNPVLQTDLLATLKQLNQFLPPALSNENG